MTRKKAGKETTLATLHRGATGNWRLEWHDESGPGSASFDSRSQARSFARGRLVVHSARAALALSRDGR